MAGNVIVLDGDGVGPEVMGAAYRVLERLGTGLDMERPLCGEAAVARGEPAFPQELREMCLAADAVLFGATGSTSRETSSLSFAGEWTTTSTCGPSDTTKARSAP